MTFFSRFLQNVLNLGYIFRHNDLFRYLNIYTFIYKKTISLPRPTPTTTPGPGQYTPLTSISSARNCTTLSTTKGGATEMSGMNEHETEHVCMYTDDRAYVFL